MKCLEKDRTRRYETANGLAMDIQRYLNDEPVSAVAPSAAYRTMKFARRHRAGLAVTAALFGMLVAGVIVSSWQMVRARQAEQGAVAARGQAEAVSEFLVDAFRSPDPERDGRTVTVKGTGKVYQFKALGEVRAVVDAGGLFKYAAQDGDDAQGLGSGP